MEEHNELNKVCRTCLCKNIEMESLFDSDVIIEMLNYVTSLGACIEDGFPNLICLHCKINLKAAYDFKSLAEKSDSYIRKVFLELTEKLQSINASFKSTNTSNCSTESNKTEMIDDEKVLKLNILPEVLPGSNTNVETTEQNISDFKSPLKFEQRSCDMKIDANNDNNYNTSTKNMINCDDMMTSSLPEDLTDFLENADSIKSLDYKCNDCSQSYASEADLQLHQSTHYTTKGNWQCSKCHKLFAGVKLLRRHIKIHLENKPHICAECGKGFAESAALTKHMHKHTGIPRKKPHVCEECGQGFCEPYYLAVHLRKHSGERPLMCSSCGKSFADPRSLKSHMQVHMDVKRKPYVCHLCNKAFNHSSVLKTHIRIHTGERPFVCADCGKSFTQSSGLDKHMKTHTGVKPFFCHICNRPFAEKSTLILHVRRHTGDKPFSCEHCDKSYASFSELKVHSRKHTGENRNTCPECNKSFSSANGLSVHARTHTGERPFPCPHCEMTFSDKSASNKHRRLHQDCSVKSKQVPTSAPAPTDSINMLTFSYENGLLKII